jgi:hypothetical protein
MVLAYLFMAAVLFLAVAGYAQYQVGSLTVADRVGPTRMVLAVTAAAFAWMVVETSRATGLSALLGFLAGFGIVHLPAAIILFLKRARHEHKS